MNIDSVIKKIRVHIAENHEGVNSKYADSMNVSGAYLSAIMTKKKPPSKVILKHLNLERLRVTTYEIQA